MFILKIFLVLVLLLKVVGRFFLFLLYGGIIGFVDVVFIVVFNMYCYGILDRMFEYIFNFIELEIGVKVIRVLRKMYYLYIIWIYKIRYFFCIVDLVLE